MALVYLSSGVCATGRELIFNLASLQWSSSFGLFVWDGVYLLFFKIIFTYCQNFFNPLPLWLEGVLFLSFFCGWIKISSGITILYSVKMLSLDIEIMCIFLDASQLALNMIYFLQKVLEAFIQLLTLTCFNWLFSSTASSGDGGAVTQEGL